MKRTGIAIAALAAFVVGALPVAASAAIASRSQPSRPAPSAPGTISNAQREQGKEEAPALVQAAKVACTVSDAFFVQASAPDPRTRTRTSLYEVACNEGMGYVLQQNPDATVSSFNCLSLEAQAAAAANPATALKCRLPANADPKQGLVPLVTAAGRTCAITGARAMGVTAAGEIMYEAACGDRGYVIKTALPGSGKQAEVADCAQYMSTTAACQLTTREQIMAGIAKLAAASGQPCEVSDGRYVGASSTGVFYEVACGAGKPGYIIRTNVGTGAFETAIDCSKAQMVAGGCTLTNVEVAEEAEAATYTKLAKENGFPCDVSKYAFIGIDEASKSEVVELACSNRPDGAVALFPAATGAKGTFYDCVSSAAIGVACKLSQPSSTYTKYTAGLVSMNKNECKVSNAKWLAATPTKQDMIETACSDGLPGFVLVVNRADGKVAELLTCGQLRGSGVSCTLPTNTTTASAGAAR